MRSVCPDHTRYTKGCTRCPIYARIYRRARLRGIKSGTWEGALLSGDALDRVRKHVRQLLATPGIYSPQVADAAGVHVSVVYKLARASTKTIHPVIGHALLALTVAECVRRQAAPDDLVDNTGAKRMLQALAADSWGTERLSVLCGIHPSELRRHRRGDRVLIRVAARDAIYELYWKIQSLADPRGTSELARRYAEEHSYLPPERWADEDITDPEAEPLPPLPATEDHEAISRMIEDALRDPAPGKAADYPRPVKAEIARHAWNRLGWSYPRIAELLGFKSESTVEYLLHGRADRPHTRKGS